MSRRISVTHTRSPAVAGAFYPGGEGSLRASIESSFVDDHGPGKLPQKGGKGGPLGSIVAGIAPHAGYRYSGPVAAHLFGRLAEHSPPKTVVIFGVNHHGLGGIFSLSDEDWRTPLGTVRTNAELLGRLAVPPLDIDGGAHRLEHSIEVELPFLQYIWGSEFTIVALQVTFTELSLLKEAGGVISEVLKGEDVLLLASTDLSHYMPPREGKKLDDMAIASILTGSPDRLYDTVERNDISMCGIAPVTLLLSCLAKERCAFELLRQGSSGDSEPMETVVGYSSFIIRRK